MCACVRVIGRLSDWRQIAPCRRLITVHNCSGHKSCGEMKFGQLVAPASTASDPKSAMLAVAPRHDGHELDARVTFATAWQVICLRPFLPPSLPLSDSPCRCRCCCTRSCHIAQPDLQLSRDRARVASARCLPPHLAVGIF